MTGPRPSTPADHPPAYLDTPDAVARFVASVASVPALAIDTEGASFHRFIDRIYLLQLSTRESSAIIDPLPIGTPAELGALLESRDVEIIFHDADYDLRLLHQDYGWKVNHIFDTRVAAQLLGIRAFGLAALLEQFFGVKLDKKHQRADWSMRPLTTGMLEYAAQDTRFLLDLRDRLADALREKGRESWAAEEFERLEGTRWAPEEQGESFLRMKGARDLDRRALALLRELVAWRDTVAGAMDRATFRVMGNETLLTLSREAPRKVADLTGIKGMPRGMADSRRAEIIAAVERGLEVPEAQLPRFPRSARWDRDPDFDDIVAKLKTVRDAAAARLELDPGVLASRDRLESVARTRPATMEELTAIPGIRRWQVAELGEEFLRVIEKAPPAPVRKAGGKARGAESKVAGSVPPNDESSPYRDA